ncbi:MAG: PorV/PorQ family protein [Bacteroidia bacterium]|nr:PorV/PorQ family protein [Bacteroidia bacterium]
MRRVFALTLTLTLLLSVLQAQVRKYSNEFLSIGVGARGLGMSNAVVAISNDVTGGYWNPAALHGVGSDLQISLMHANYFANLAKYDYIGIARRFDSSSVGSFSFIRFGVDDIPNTTELIDNQGNVNYNNITTFSAADYAFIFSYARNFGIPGLQTGGSFKIIRRKVGDFGGAWGFGLDAGARLDKGRFVYGLMLRDVTSTFNAWSFNLSESMKETFLLTGNEIPESSVEITLPRMITGLAYRIDLTAKTSMVAEADLDWTFDGKRNVLIRTSVMSIDPHLGAEFAYKDLVFLRGGIGNIQQETDFDNKKHLTIQPNIGLGLRLRKIRLDYAMTDIGDASVALYSHIFSLRFDITKKNQ